LELKNTVLLPGIVIPITAGRQKSIEAINKANSGDKLIGILSQKDPEIEDPTLDDLYTVGTVARILKLIKMPDGSITVIIQGKKKFVLKKMLKLKNSTLFLKIRKKADRISVSFFLS